VNFARKLCGLGDLNYLIYSRQRKIAEKHCLWWFFLVEMERHQDAFEFALVSRIEGIRKEHIMVTAGNKVNLFADRCSQQWVVLDTDGNYWILSTSDDNPWGQRLPFNLTEETELEPMPGHYKHMFGIPT
jgi:hypothetical protein